MMYNCTNNSTLSGGCLPKYKLLIMSPDGAILEEKAEFKNRSEAEKLYGGRGYTVLECKRELPEILSLLKIFSRKKKISKQELADFCFYFGRALDMGLPILEATEDIKNSVENDFFKEKLERLRELLMAGESISSAMAMVEIFPPELVGLVKLGENSNALPQVFLNYAEYLDWLISLEKEIKQALSYPAFVSIVLIFTIAVMFAYIIPNVIPAIKSLGLKEMPIPTKLLMWSGNFIPKYWKHFIVLTILTFIILKLLLKKNEKFRFFWDRVKLKLPLIGQIFLKSSLSRDVRAIAEVYRSGGTIIDAVNLIISDVELNLYLKNIFKSVKETIMTGVMLSQALERTGFFPSIVIRMVKLGEDTGALDNALLRVASIYEDDMRRKIQTMTVIIEPMLQLILGVILGIIALGILLPVYDIVSKLGAM